jgi:serine/threonine-protein kinase
MGAVYLGQHTLLGRRAAIKVLLPALSARPDVVNRFFNEARALTSISDPGIVQVFDFGYHTDGSAFIVMEHLEGERLDQRLARLRRFSVPEALRLCRQLAGSLATVHAEHIIHRDLKPENIFLVLDKEVASGERSKILDFGISKLSDDPPGKLKTNTGVLMGTPMYMSPEQCRGLAEIDHRLDIYALGCVLFHLLTGRPPFEGEGTGDVISAHIREPASAPSSRVAGIPPSVDALVLRCLAKAPADRYQTMDELAAAIELVVQQVPTGEPVVEPSAHDLAPTVKMPQIESRTVPITKGTIPTTKGTIPTTVEMIPTTVETIPTTVGKVPTTIGGSSGEFTLASPRARSSGLWIAAGLAVAVVGILMVMIEMRGSDVSGPTSHSAAATVPIERTPPPAGGSSVAGMAQDAGSVALGELHGGTPGASAPAAVNSGDAGGAGSAATAPTQGETTSPKSNAPAALAVAPGTEPSRKPPPHHKPPVAIGGARPSPSPEHPSSPAAPSARTCSKAVFAAVYNAAAPAPEVVHAALRTLNECHAAGAVNDAEFEQTQAALIARL